MTSWLWKPPRSLPELKARWAGIPRGQKVTAISALLVLGVVGAAFRENPDAKGGQDRKSAAFHASKDFVRRELFSPSTASFPWSVHSDGVSVTYSSGRDEYDVRAYVDGTNAYGGTLRKRYACKLRDLGHGQWQCISVDLDR